MNNAPLNAVSVPIAADGAHDPCSHLANAYRLVQHFGDKLLFVEGIGWHVWGPPWRADELGAKRIAHQLGGIIAQEGAALAQLAASADNKQKREERERIAHERFKWAGKSESAPCVEFSLSMAAPMLACKAEALDADPMLLGTPSGVLELESGDFREHRQDDRLTKVAGCDFDPSAEAATWERFVSEAMGGDAELVDYLQRLAGYTLCGARGEHLLPILWGSGANGKSTFLSALQALLGDYASGAAPGMLIRRNGNEHPTALADLQGRRLVVVCETGEAGRLNEEQAKALTGGDAITARRMRQDFYTFKPTHQLFLQTNHRPRVSGTDEGVWRRLRLIPFTVTVPPEKRDPHLSEKLCAELPGILGWVYIGWIKYRQHGFNTPEAVKLATSEYRESSDVLAEFLTERCTAHPHLTANAGDLYRAYQQWCYDNGEHARSQKDFGMRLAERGFVQDRSKTARRWRGIGIQEVTHGDAWQAKLA